MIIQFFFRHLVHVELSEKLLDLVERRVVTTVHLGHGLARKFSGGVYRHVMHV